MEQTHCTKHALELEEITLREAVERSLFFRIMRWFTSAAYYDKWGEERTVLACPKNDFLKEA